ncbi:hypothetical protein K7X08_030670 [Anisodus acutangulus]|uniref:Uncharacterized protein n=1 Tax=Anisodus acutangulus TaxID=402998 RepID=A0A9Q1M2T3_9SOLA|nr:hypothetical protein K7X08_030670 [Anisodus acutangulus]
MLLHLRSLRSLDSSLVLTWFQRFFEVVGVEAAIVLCGGSTLVVSADTFDVDADASDVMVVVVVMTAEVVGVGSAVAGGAGGVAADAEAALVVDSADTALAADVEVAAETVVVAVETAAFVAANSAAYATGNIEAAETVGDDDITVRPRPAWRSSGCWLAIFARIDLLLEIVEGVGVDLGAAAKSAVAENDDVESASFVGTNESLVTINQACDDISSSGEEKSDSKTDSDEEDEEECFDSDPEDQSGDNESDVEMEDDMEESYEEEMEHLYVRHITPKYEEIIGKFTKENDRVMIMFDMTMVQRTCRRSHPRRQKK